MIDDELFEEGIGASDWMLARRFERRSWKRFSMRCENVSEIELGVEKQCENDRSLMRICGEELVNVYSDAIGDNC